MKPQETIYAKYLERLRVKLIAKYDELGLRASGKFAESLEAETKPTKAIMWGVAYAGAMEGGRRAGGFPPRSDIEDWIEVKQGLPAIFKERKKQFAFLIARKIAEEGIQVPNEHNKGAVISSVVDAFLADDVYEMMEELGYEHLNRIESDVITILKEVA